MVLTLTDQLANTAWPRMRPQDAGNVFRPASPQVVQLPVPESA
jgi:hypothetical protein